MKKLILLLLLSLVAVGCNPFAKIAINQNVTAPSGQVPRFDHVFIVTLENHSYNEVIGNKNMPYTNSLVAQHATAAAYYGNTHPSIGNYFMLTTGTVTTNDTYYTGTITDNNLAREITKANKTWRVYAESIPHAGYTGGDSGLYVRRHNPFTYFSDTLNNPAQAANIVALTQLSKDLEADTLPNFALIVPNNCNNGHDCDLKTVDTWLQKNLQPIITQPSFKQKGLLVVTFDEGNEDDDQHGGGHIPTLFISSKIKPGYTSSIFYQHEHLLRTVSEAMGLGTYLGASADVAPMSDLFETKPR